MEKEITTRRSRGILDTKVKRNMIQKAKKIHKRIFPCGLKASIEECFTITEDSILLWFNTIDKNTYVVMTPRRVNNGTQIQ